MHQVPNIIRNVVWMGDNVKHHHTQRVFKTPVRGPWINQIGECQLVDMTKALKRARIKNLALIAV